MTPLPAPKKESPLPWEEGPALYEWLQKIAEAQPAPPLPDGCRLDARRLLFGPQEGESSASCESSQAAAPEDPARLETTAQRILEALIRASTAHDHTPAGEWARLYESVREEPMLALADPLTELICTERERLDAERLAHLARWLTRRAAHREPLKLGLIVLGLVGEPEDLPDLIHLARHDEFSLYVAVAAGRILHDPCGTWWRMARENRGAGRLALLERLATHCNQCSDIQRWLLTDGYRVPGFEARLALPCAQGARLSAVLATPTLPEDLLDASCELMCHLLRSPGEGEPPPINGYSGARYAVAHLLRHLLERSTTTLGDAEVAVLIHDWLESDHALSCTSPTLRRTLQHQCEALLSRSHWLRLVSTSVKAGTGAERLRAYEVAQRLGLDLWEEALESFNFATLSAPWVRCLAANQSTERRQRLIQLGRHRLEHATIATGPEERLRLDEPGYEAHATLDAFLQLMCTELGTLFEPRLVATAVQSPVLRNRYAAANILHQVPRHLWGASLEQAVRETEREEPDEELAEHWATLQKKTD